MATVDSNGVDTSKTIMLSPGDPPGTDVGITTERPGIIRVLHSATFFNYPCASSSKRRYFRVLENGIEQNVPICSCLKLAPPMCAKMCSKYCTCCCMECCFYDLIEKSYFDRGYYDMRDCLHWTMILQGAPKPFAGEVKHICCCVNCSQGCNELMSCYFPNVCGDRVRYVPCETYCCCCSTRANCFSNFFGLCGPRDGEPLTLLSFEDCLAVGEAERVVAAMINARTMWSKRTNLN